MESLGNEDFLVVKKKSRIEVDAVKMDLDWQKVLDSDIMRLVSERYNHNREFIKRNLEAHHELYDSVEFLHMLGFKEIIEREDFDIKKLENKKAVISVGGDNHLIWILDQIEYLGYSVPVIAMNSSVNHSTGGLLYDNKDTIEKTLCKCETGDYRIEEWPKIEGEIEFGGEKIKLFPSAQEYILGEYAGTQMSRWVLKGEEQKGNRLIVANGAGSSSWYSAIHRILFGEKDIFDRTSREIRHIIDGSAGNISGYNHLFGRVLDKEVLEVISYNDSRGAATADCHEEEHYIFDFPFGSIARLRVSEKVSKIIRR